MSTAAPLRVCSEPGCPMLVASGRCAAHQRPSERPDYHALYQTRRWRRASVRFLQLYPLCGDRPNGLPPVMSVCHERGFIERATQTDHVEPHRGNLNLFWDSEGNWQALCASCGARKARAGL